MPHDVFVSYSRRDGIIAEAIVHALQANGVSCWIDHKLKRMPGAEWQAEISKAIEQSRVIILVYSHHANASTHVADEVNLARQLNKPIIAFRLQDVAPDHALRLALSRSQWLDAMPLTKKQLQLLVGGVCRLLDRVVSVHAGLTAGDKLRILWYRTMAWLTVRRQSARQAESVTAEVPAELPDVPEENHPHDFKAMVATGKWMQLKTLIDHRESRGLPLRQLAEYKTEAVRRFEAFERLRVKALAGIEHLGPNVADAFLQKLAAFVPDHPDVDGIRKRVLDMRAEQATLRRSLNEFERQDRWIAAENLIRSAASQRGIATSQLLRAAETASGKAMKESRRFDLLLWALLVGFGLVSVLVGIQRQVSASDGWEVNGAWLTLAAQLVISPFLMVAGLAFFGKRLTGVGLGFAVMWTVVGLIAEGVAIIAFSSQAQVSQLVLGRVLGSASIACAIAMLGLMSLGTSAIVSSQPRVPGIAAVVAAMASSEWLPWFLFGSGASRGWLMGLAEGSVAAGFFAISGCIGSRRIWLTFVLAEMAVVLFIEKALGLWISTFAGVLFAGPLFALATSAYGRKKLPVIIWIFSIAVFSFAICQVSSWADSSSAAVPFSGCVRLVTLWAIACGSVALDYGEQLGAWRPADWFHKVLSARVVYAGTRLSAFQLTNTDWYKTARAWHERRVDTAQDSDSTRSPPSRRGGKGEAAEPQSH